MEQKDIYLSVIIPAYNEDERIEITIHQVYKYLARVPYTWEIIVVSDGSKDLTIQKVSQLAKSRHAFRLLERLGTEPKVYYISAKEWVRRAADNYLPHETKKMGKST